jgi:acetoacetate decarboxylase
MRVEEILHLPSMPLAGPSYPKGPYRFVNREYMVISYETDPEIIRAQLPEPFEPVDSPLVHYEWIKMPDSSGFGLHRKRRRNFLPLQRRRDELRRADVPRR